MKTQRGQILVMALAAMSATVAFFGGAWFICGLLNQVLSITPALAMIVGSIAFYIFMSLLEKEDLG